MPHCIHLASDLHLGAPGYASSVNRERDFVRWMRHAARGEGFAEGAQATEIHLVGDVFAILVSKSTLALIFFLFATEPLASAKVKKL